MAYLESTEALRKAVTDEREILAKDFDWDADSDIRIRVFDQFNNLIRPFSLTLLFYEDHLADDAYLDARVKPRTKLDAKGVRENYLVYIKVSFIYSLTAVVESNFRSLLRAVNPKNMAASDFGKVKNALLESLGNSEPNYCRDATTLLFTIRNCIHNNGVHFSRDGSNLTIDYREKAYHFAHGSMHGAADFETVIQLAFDQVRLMRHIVKHEKVRDLGQIRDTGM